MFKTIAEIKSLITKNKTDEALELLESEVKSARLIEAEKSIILLKSKLNALTQDNLRGIIDYNLYSQGVAQINNNILLLIEKIPNTESLNKERKILFIYSNPNEKYNLGFEKEVEQIRNALEKSRFRNEFGLIVEVQVTFEDIEGLIEKYSPEIIHFCIWSLKNGGEGMFLFHGANGLEVEVPVENFTELFQDIKESNKSVRSVVLNTCFSKVYAEKISKYIDTVIAMNDLVEDEYFPFEFSRLLYTNLFNGKSISDSFKKTILSIKMNTQLRNFNFIDKAPHEIPIIFEEIN